MDHHPTVKRIELTRGHSCLVDDADYDRLNRFKWFALTSKTGPVYAARKQFGKTLLMHRVLLGLSNPRIKGEHKNGDGCDNQRLNLRTATDMQNQRAFKTPRKGKTSSYRGVSWDPRGLLWKAQISVNKKVVYLGRFYDETTAAREYDKAAREHFGEFACPNFR